uniref:Uncharacterized protein n=1 Tax=Bubo bubo TaxID=30461 RepID=A0A8C0EDW2_BUBBB
AYASTKESHPYVKSVCDAAEKGVKTLTAAAVSGAQPILTKLEPQIYVANAYGCKGLEEKLGGGAAPHEFWGARKLALAELLQGSRITKSCFLIFSLNHHQIQRAGEAGGEAGGGSSTP